MSEHESLDLTELRRTWQAHRAALREIVARIDTRGMTRPARDPEEYSWLNEHGGGVFVEDPATAALAGAYYERKYVRPE